MLREVTGKTVTLNRQPIVLYSSFTYLTSLTAAIPDDKRSMLSVTPDTITANVQGFQLGVHIANRVPFSRIEFEHYGQSPFPFYFTMHFDSSNIQEGMTDFHIELKAELNTMMNMMLGGRMQELVDHITDAVAAAASGNVPADFHL